MATITFGGLADPDHEVYKSGPVIGGKRFVNPAEAIRKLAEERQRERHGKEPSRGGA